MSNDVVQLVQDQDYEALAQLTGAYTSSASSLIPNLKINREAETDDGKQVPTGTFMVSQDGVGVYGKVAQFRVFLNTYQYMVYDAKTNTFPNKSIIFKNFNEDIIDELGGTRCGKISFKKLQELTKQGLISDDELAKQKTIKCYRGLYGLVTINDAVTANGEKTTVENLPVLWRTANTNFNAAQDALNAISKLRHVFFQHWLTLTLQREKQGSNIYYKANVTPVLNEEVEFTSDDMITFKMFQEIINRENKYVAAKWASTKKSEAPFALGALSELDLNDSLEDI